MERLFTKEFWLLASGRAFRTFLQSFVASLSACAVIQDLNIGVLLSTTAVAVLMSFATSMLTVLPEETARDKANGAL